MTTASANPNMKLWEATRGVDKRFTKPITGKSYKGDSPNPTYIIMKITEQLGPIGREWGFVVVNQSVIEGMPHQIAVKREESYYPAKEGQPLSISQRCTEYQIIRETTHQVQIEFWQNVDGQRRTFSAFGATPMLYLSSKGKWICDEDAAKKSLTDAYTKAASWLGVVADIFLGLYDGKYQAPSEGASGPSSPAQIGDTPPATPPSGARTSTAPSEDGW